MKKNEIEMIEYEQQVKVRRYEVDKLALYNMLKAHKSMSNKVIAEQLKVPLTQVEHYFRKDKYQAIPDPLIWDDLKKCLHIEDDLFDEAIMTFDVKPGVFEKANRFYFDCGICPTLTCGDDIKVIQVIKDE